VRKLKKNLGMMNRIAELVRGKGECSLGEIEIELNISIWKQYELDRAYREYFKDVRLVKGSWQLITAKEPLIVPLNRQDTLSHSLSLSLSLKKRGVTPSDELA
jgi:hypothetical protein